MKYNQSTIISKLMIPMIQLFLVNQTYTAQQMTLMSWFFFSESNSSGRLTSVDQIQNKWFQWIYSF